MFADILKGIREFVAIWHYISDVLALIEFIQLISGNGLLGGLVLWVVSASISGLIAEFFESMIPTPLRIFFNKMGFIR